MAKTCMVLGPSGDGKSTATVVNPDGSIDFTEDKYLGLDPKTTVILNADGKDLPYPYGKLGWKEGRNLFSSTYESPLDAENVTGIIQKINESTKEPRIKAIIIDTINGSMNDKEMLDTKKMTYDKWADLAKDYYRLCVQANSMREDLVIYLLGHTVLTTQQDGTEMRHLVTNGRKLEKIHLETKIPIVLHTIVEPGVNGENKYFFETQKNRSSGKSPYGMFDEFLIPNSLSFVDNTIREYYGI